MPTVQLNGIDVYYERSGSGPPLLYCNGSLTTLDTTRSMLRPYAERLEVVAHDQRGLGRTTVPDQPATMADYAADALALADRLGWDTFRVVGVSFGGMVAQEIAVTAPRRIERLALLCTSPGGAGGSSGAFHELGSVDAGSRRPTAAQYLDRRWDEAWLEAHPNDQAFADGLLSVTTGDAPVDPERARGQQIQLAARAGHDVYDRLGRISCPTLVACGRYDGLAPLANGEAVAARIPDVELRVYDGGHVFFAQDPTAVPEIVDFLAS